MPLSHLILRFESSEGGHYLGAKRKAQKVLKYRKEAGKEAGKRTISRTHSAVCLLVPGTN